MPLLTQHCWHLPSRLPHSWQGWWQRLPGPTETKHQLWPLVSVAMTSPPQWVGQGGRAVTGGDRCLHGDSASRLISIRACVVWKWDSEWDRQTDGQTDSDCNNSALQEVTERVKDTSNTSIRSLSYIILSFQYFYCGLLFYILYYSI